MCQTDQVLAYVEYAAGRRLQADILLEMLRQLLGNQKFGYANFAKLYKKFKRVHSSDVPDGKGSSVRPIRSRPSASR